MEVPNIPPNVEDIESAIDRICEELKAETVDKFAHEIHIHNRARGIGYAYKGARDRVDGAWRTFEGRVSIVSGKKLLSKLSEWSKSEFNVSFGIATVTSEMQVEDLADEVVAAISAIEDTSTFTDALANR